MKLKKLNEDYLIEMASIQCDKKLSIGASSFIVRPNERGYIPHFHIHLKADGNNFNNDICVRLDEPEYFIHGSHTGTLNTGDCRKTNEFLHESYDDDITNWRYLAITWNHDHPDARISSKSCPNYLELIGKG